MDFHVLKQQGAFMAIALAYSFFLGRESYSKNPLTKTAEFVFLHIPPDQAVAVAISQLFAIPWTLILYRIYATAAFAVTVAAGRSKVDLVRACSRAETIAFEPYDARRTSLRQHSNGIAVPLGTVEPGACRGGSVNFPSAERPAAYQDLSLVEMRPLVRSHPVDYDGRPARRTLLPRFYESLHRGHRCNDREPVRQRRCGREIDLGRIRLAQHDGADTQRTLNAITNHSAVGGIQFALGEFAGRMVGELPCEQCRDKHKRDARSDRRPCEAVCRYREEQRSEGRQEVMRIELTVHCRCC